MEQRTDLNVAVLLVEGEQGQKCIYAFLPCLSNADQNPAGEWDRKLTGCCNGG